MSLINLKQHPARLKVTQKIQHTVLPQNHGMAM